MSRPTHPKAGAAAPRCPSPGLGNDDPPKSPSASQPQGLRPPAPGIRESTPAPPNPVCRPPAPPRLLPGDPLPGAPRRPRLELNKCALGVPCSVSVSSSVGARGGAERTWASCPLRAYRGPPAPHPRPQTPPPPPRTLPHTPGGAVPVLLPLPGAPPTRATCQPLSRIWSRIRPRARPARVGGDRAPPPTQPHVALSLPLLLPPGSEVRKPKRK